jgi:3-hydroxyisobutyrate dehydrogenase
LELALNQLIDAGRDVGFRPKPWIGAAGGCSHGHLYGDLAGIYLVRSALEKKLQRLLTRDYKHPNFSALHHLKDVELFLKDTSSYELTATSLEGMRQVLERSIAQRLGYSDYSAIFEMVNPIP